MLLMEVRNFLNREAAAGKGLNTRKARLLYLLSFLVLLGIEILIALFVHDEFIRPYIGDVLAVIVLYAAVRIIRPDGIRLLPLYIFHQHKGNKLTNQNYSSALQSNIANITRKIYIFSIKAYLEYQVLNICV